MTVTRDYNYDPLEWARMTARRSDATPAMIAMAIPVLRRAGGWEDHVTADELAKMARRHPDKRREYRQQTALVAAFAIAGCISIACQLWL